MDMLENGLDQNQEKPTEASSEEPVQIVGSGDGGDDQAASVTSGSGNLTLASDSNVYQFRTEGSQGGQVTYRVVQVDPGDQGSQQSVLTTTALPGGTQVAHAVIQSPFGTSSSPQPEGQGEPRFAYFPAVTADQQGTASQAQSDMNATPINQVAQSGGQFYVMMSPQDVLQNQRSIAPRTVYSPKADGNRTSRDERRRATHNEVERRRRDKINNWIVSLSKLIPDCVTEQNKAGQVSTSSKGGILAKACEYITELRNANNRMAESLKDTERLAMDVELLRQQVDELKQEKAILSAQLQNHGIQPTDIGT